MTPFSDRVRGVEAGTDAVLVKAVPHVGPTEACSSIAAESTPKVTVAGGFGKMTKLAGAVVLPPIAEQAAESLGHFFDLDEIQAAAGRVIAEASGAETTKSRQTIATRTTWRMDSTSRGIRR